MKCCAFGTVRMDIHVYTELNNFEKHEEIKIDEMSMAVGGSVYNTVSVLTQLKQKAVLYMLNATDDFNDFIKIKMNNRHLTYVSCDQDKNDTAKSLIFVDGQGKKKTISYDGVRQDKSILNILYEDIDKFDLFYTSFYEINKENYRDILKIMTYCPKNFVDLSPLIYSIDSEILSSVLMHIHILSGTEEEFEILMNKLNCKSPENLLSEYFFDYLFVKRGKNGATVFTKNSRYDYEPKEKRTSHDTTGCGDTFNAGIIYSLSNKYDDEKMLQQAVEMATKVAYEGFNEGMFE